MTTSMTGASTSSVPKPALTLGAAGLIPFVGLLILGFVGPEEVAALAMRALRGYAACILSFMGGVHWGLAIDPATREPRMDRLAVSVVPALLGWVALLIPAFFGYLLLTLAFAGLLAYDLRETRLGHAPGWYPALRMPLTVVVVLCLLLAPLA